MVHHVSRVIGGRTLSIETGLMAKQADGAVTIRYGDTIVLVAVVRADPRPGIDFFPLTVDYREKTYAAGKIPGGFFKREGRPTTKETLTCRVIDRPIRPLFPEGYHDEIQVSANVLSADQQNDPDMLALVGASAALSISNVPFLGPIGAVRLGLVEGRFIVNPTETELATSQLDLVVAGTRDAITMVECGAKEITEDVMVDALRHAHAEIKQIVAMIDELVTRCGQPKIEVAPVTIEDSGLYGDVKGRYWDDFVKALFTPTKLERRNAVRAVKQRAAEEMVPEGDEEAVEKKKELKAIFEQMEYRAIREIIVKQRRRVDGRDLVTVRPITCQVGILPRAHGSALFTRGETQALVVATLGTQIDEQIVDGLIEEYKKKFMLHYNFPHFSVGEAGPIRGPGRREIGHGALAERSLEQVLPAEEEFPYTVRIVSDILESNGSSSMATVCGGTLCMMDAGVKIKKMVAGVAMGLVKEGDDVCILTDILGDEDHHGDMDFKVAGTDAGITGLQMDIKIAGLSDHIMKQALEQARVARLHVLSEMRKVLDQPREAISVYAPKMVLIKINPEKIGMLIGPGGKNVRKIQEDTGAVIEIEDDGTVRISSTAEESVRRAREYVEALTKEVEVGQVYKGKVIQVKEFGAFIEILPGQEGLCHVSELSDRYVENVQDVVKIGDELDVKVILVDDSGRIKLSHRALMKPADGQPPGGGGPGEPRREGPHQGQGGGQGGQRRGGEGDRERQGGPGRDRERGRRR
ncbi:MAG: polyribonucleotide nucleotidyltransferase [Planctomycetes bacterium]|nr:polyribonucleotide nucleotidyltransferase [Planctomycetota bacterium]